MFGPRTKFCSAAILSVVAWAAACTATRNADGSITVFLTPDLTITAWGLEDALEKLTDLLDKCITGNFERPCTAEEMTAINRAIDNVLERKRRMGDPPGPGSAPPHPL